MNNHWTKVAGGLAHVRFDRFTPNHLPVFHVRGNVGPVEARAAATQLLLSGQYDGKLFRGTVIAAERYASYDWEVVLFPGVVSLVCDKCGR